MIPKTTSIIPTVIKTRRYPESTSGPVTTPTMTINVACTLPTQEMDDGDCDVSSTV
jgi:hypothetical protein